MPPEGTGAAATAGAGATPGQSGNSGQQQPGAQGGDGATAGAAASATPDAASQMQTDGGREALRKERERADAAEKALKELQEKDLPAAERATRRATELEASDKAKDADIRDLKTQNSAIRIAIRLGFADADDALGFLALNKSKIDFDDANNPTNLEAVLKDLLKSKPHLARGATPATPGSGDGGARGGSPVDMNARIREASRR